MLNSSASSTPPTIAPLDLLLQPRVIASVILTGEMLAAVLALAPGIRDSRWVYFGLTSLMIQWISILTLVALHAMRRQLRSLRPNTIAHLSLATLLAVTGVACALVWALFGDLLNLLGGNWWALWLQVNGIAVTVGLLGLLAFQNHWRAQQMAVRAKQAELDALQARIHPHFLFNTLNTGAVLIHQRPEAAERLLLDLSDLFRAALAGPSQIVLEQELSLTRRYLEIEQLRFGSRLCVEWQLPTPLPLVLVPTLCIQTLAENAIRHGVEPATEGGAVTLSVAITSNQLQIQVTNCIPTASRENSGGHRIGLNAVRSRVEQLTNGIGNVDTEIKDGRHFATIHLPYP
ncbi:two-component system sensor histidine kinase AlgZ [Xanthomonas arboricola]|uniref:sensor histidine kinase n=1 Tax=Xanthomonas euroxanthea TaxID=2259622 RepID=UPI00141B6CC0|nr:histidine kinase [Xanthomonas euroxanthea]NIK10154.1 two-component system sensor histidine kinase AlgZ [Xanthomonas euroxanthea]